MSAWSVSPAWLVSSRPSSRLNRPGFLEDGQVDEADNDDMDLCIVWDVVQEEGRVWMVCGIRGEDYLGVPD